MNTRLTRVLLILALLLANQTIQAQSSKSNKNKNQTHSSGVVANMLPVGGGGDPIILPAGAYIRSPATGSTFTTGVAIAFQGDTDDGTTFSWAFGDGTTATGLTTSKTYVTAGSYTVRFTASAVGSKTSTTSIAITIAAPSKPVIHSFDAIPATITAGGNSTLAWSVDGATNLAIQASPGGSGVVSGSSLVVTPNATTTYNLTASNAQGSVSASKTVTVYPAPVISSLTAAANPVAAGASTTLIPVFSGGTAFLYPSIGLVTSGTSYSTGTLTMGKTYTLTVYNPLGATATKHIMIDIRIAAGVLKWKKDIVYVSGKEVAEVDPAGTEITMSDYLGSPRFSWRGAGTPVITQKFLPFGETLSDPTSAGAFAKGYTNHQQTDPSGLIYMQARFYAPMYGRFLSPDPARDQHFEETQSWNVYSYALNNPVMLTDPTGLAIPWYLGGDSPLVDKALLALYNITVRANPGYQMVAQPADVLSATVNAVAEKNIPMMSNLGQAAERGAGTKALLVNHAFEVPTTVMAGEVGGNLLGRTASFFSQPVGTPAVSGALQSYRPWPSNGGFLGGFSKTETAQAGQILSRIGDLDGTYFSPMGTSLGARGLPANYPNQTETLWQVVKPFQMDGGIAAPWMGGEGLGVQYKSLDGNVQSLWDAGKITPFTDGN